MNRSKYCGFACCLPNGPAGQSSFPDHNYNSQMSSHCPPSSYPSYMNGPYPVSNSRAHHYGNQHLQQGPPPPSQLPYRPNFGPPPGQYIPTPLQPNQELYRNHPGYVGNTTRTFHGKAGWGESNSGDMMTSYNHGPQHPQMMNSSGPMNVSSMRSPPHIPSAVNPVPSPGSQHYRQMQSPGHSPQTWPQVQVPSPGMHPVARTTPSPLQSHARSPGHGQPFSPSATSHMPTPVNIPSHPISSVVPDNQSTGQNMTGIMPTGPLHSLQKMVMLEQESNSMQLNCELANENSCEPMPVCSSNSVEPEDHNSEEETKESSFATYYNLDENRLESKPQTASAFKDSNYNVSVPLTEVSSSPRPLISNNDVPSSENHLPEAGMQHPQAYSVPTVRGNDKCDSVDDIPNGSSKCTPDDSTQEDMPKPVDTPIKNDSEDSSNIVFAKESPDTTKKGEENYDSSANEASSANEDSSANAGEQELSDHSVPVDSLPNQKDTNDNADKPQLEDAITKVATTPEPVADNEAFEESMEFPVSAANGKSKLVSLNSNTVLKAVPSGRHSSSATAETVAYNPNKFISIGATKLSASEIAQNPVKVVIHRIRANSTNDTWHVPNSNGNAIVENNEDSPPQSTSGDSPSRTSKIGPQIIILSPAMSRKKFGASATGNPKPVVSVKKEKVDSDIGSDSSVSTTSQPVAQKSKGKKATKRSSPAVKLTPNSVAKKRGNAVAKPKAVKRRRRGKQKDNKRKKPELCAPELPAKPKKLKPFAGPYIRLTGNKATPSSITVVNMALREEEKGKNTRSKIMESNVKRPRVGHTSTLSPHYDAFNKDRTWLCAFCQKGSHCNGLGDLYGPYYIKFDSTLPIEVDGPCSSRARSKRRKSDASVTECSKTPTSRKSSKQTTKPTEPQEPTKAIQDTPTEQTPASDEPAPKEVWIHEDCAVWCQSISLMGSQICGLEEAIEEACKNVCSCCKLSGATLGCWCKGCTEQYHFICAKEKGCKLNIENFSLFCCKHKDVKYHSEESTS